MATKQASLEALREEIVHLRPWHLDVEVVPGLSTSASLDAEPVRDPSLGEVGFLSPRESFKAKMLRLYPNGLEGRSVLDCACNCGGYLFWAKELGAGECVGFDVRSHWINQARFLARHRGGDIRFEALDLYDLPKLELSSFDITIFSGIFYHLPMPMEGLKIVADRTRELLIVNTAARNNLPDGMLVAERESTSVLMSGVYGLNWLPTGPRVIERMVEWLGFSQTRCSRWRGPVASHPERVGRFEVLAAREEGFFAAFDRPLTDEALAQAIDRLPKNLIPEGATVTVADGAVELEHLRESGASYLLVPAPVLDANPGLREQLDRCTLEFRELGVAELYAL